MAASSDLAWERVSHSVQYDVNCSILLTEWPLLDRPSVAKNLGFEGIEFWWPFESAAPTDRQVDRFITAVENSGVELVCLNFYGGDLPAGDRGITSSPGREREFADSAEVAAGIGAQLGCRRFNVLYGNRIDGYAPERQDELAVDNLRAAAQTVEALGGMVLLEPISGVDSYPLKTGADVLTAIDRVRRPNVRVLVDLYHLAVNGDSVEVLLRTQAKSIGHVQIADAPGRHEPGSGDLPLAAQLELLAQGGYTGWVGLEYTPIGSSVASLEWLQRSERDLREPRPLGP